jgi:FlaA1/EpsC-like NDP-sugar epimerase
MGATKRVAEYVVEWASRRARPGQTFVSVRFGNVLGSRGSVVPLFREQIRAGGPVTVTHPEMRRYFMTIPEAAQLVLQAGGLGGNGAVYVLDMGEPVRIVDLAKDLIRLSGLEPGVDIEIVFTGIRPGEKLYEELLTAEEGTEASKHEKIFVARKNGLPDTDLDELLQPLFEAARSYDGVAVRRALKALVPGYQWVEEPAASPGQAAPANAEPVNWPSQSVRSNTDH